MNLKKYLLVTFIFTLVCVAGSYIFAAQAGYKGKYETNDEIGTFLAEKYLASRDIAIEVAQEVKIEKQNINSITVDVPAEDVSVHTVEGENIVIKVNGQVINTDKDRVIPEIIKTEISNTALKIAVNEEALRTYVNTKTKSGFWQFNVNGLTVGSGVGFDISIPSQVKNLELYSISGDVNLVGGDYDSVFVKATTGDVRMTKAKAKEFQFDLISGDVKGELDSPKITGESTSGDIKLKLGDADGEVELSMISGDIKLSFKDKGDFKLDASTTGGDIKINDRKTKDEDDVGNRVEMIFGNGNGHIKLKSTSGDIRVKDETAGEVE